MKGRSGNNIVCLISFLVELTSCRFEYENCNKSSFFLNLIGGEGMNLRNSNGFEKKNFHFTTVWKLFSRNFTGSGKLHHVGINLGTSKLSK